MIYFTITTFSVILLIARLSIIFRENRAVGTSLFLLTGIILILFATFRSIGSDQDSVAYQTYYMLDDYTISVITEPTFLFISTLSRHLAENNGVSLLFFFYALIGVCLKYTAIYKLTRLRWLSVIVYFSTYFLLHEFTQIRAGVASGLLLISIIYIAERNVVKFFITISAASLFHYSAIVAFPLYLLGNGSINRRTLLVLSAAIPVGAAIHFTQFDILVSLPIKAAQLKLETYYAVEELRNLKINVFNSLYLIRYIILYIFIYFSYKIEIENKYFTILLKVYAISLFSYLALSKNAVLSMRISELYGVVELILIPLLYYTVRPRIIPTVLILLFAAVSLGINIYWSELVKDVL